LVTIDRWGKFLTVAVVVLRLTLFGAYGHAGWQSDSRIAG
jgi:hypothetical protein